MQISMIDISELTAHPLNSEIFSSNERDDAELMSSIKMHGVMSPLLVNYRAGGEKRVISGHRRMVLSSTAGLTQIKHERIFVSDAEELLLLYALNVGRDMKESYKLRFFKQVKQYLRQNKEFVGILGKSDLVAENNPFVEILDRMGVDAKKMKIWELVQAITGFTEYEQYALTRIGDEDYRQERLSEIKGKVSASTIKEIRQRWEVVENNVLNGASTITSADKDLKMILAKIAGIKGAPKSVNKEVKKPEAEEIEVSAKVEQPVKKGENPFANTFENALAYLKQKSTEKKRWQWSVSDVAEEMEEWARVSRRK